MKAVIIEDELLTAEDLAAMLLKLPHQMEVLKILTSVQESLEYFVADPKPDIIFCDIELGDGHSFEIFKRLHLNVPVIFCTAYNKYALEAFDNNGIGYVLKPFTRKAIQEAIGKFIGLRNQWMPAAADVSLLLSGIRLAQERERKDSALLVNWKDKIIPIRHTDIALFGVEYKTSFLVTKTNQRYHVAYTLEELEQICGSSFYRANRQYLINRNAVQDATQYSARKLFIKLRIEGEFDITIAKAKVPAFLSWLRN
jgi:two-component system, LytTR family, response regulator LytT